MADATRVVVAQVARVYIAQLGVPAPTTATDPLDSRWCEAGYFTPDSLKWNTDPSFEEIRSAQSNYATRRVQTQDTATAEVDLQEWAAQSFYSVYGGGTFTADSGVYKFVPPAIGARVSIAVIIEIRDGAKVYRRIVPKAMQVEGVEQTFQRASESTLPLRLSITGDDIADAWYDLTNDPAFDSGVVIIPVYPDTILYPDVTLYPQG